jgi:hypothetical protein
MHRQFDNEVSFFKAYLASPTSRHRGRVEKEGAMLRSQHQFVPHISGTSIQPTCSKGLQRSIHATGSTESPAIQCQLRKPRLRKINI